MQTTLNEIYNGSDGKGSKNSDGEYVYFKFNLISVETDDLTGGDDANIRKMAYEYGLEGLKYESKSLVRAPIVTKGSTYGALGVHKGNRISIAANGPDITFAHEVGHSLGLRDSQYSGGNRGSLMDYPPTRILTPKDVDTIWKRAFDKY